MLKAPRGLWRGKGCPLLTGEGSGEGAVLSLLTGEGSGEVAVTLPRISF